MYDPLCFGAWWSSFKNWNLCRWYYCIFHHTHIWLLWKPWDDSRVGGGRTLYCWVVKSVVLNNATTTTFPSFNRHRKSSLLPLKWMMLSYLKLLVSVFLDLSLHPSWIRNLMSSLSQNRHHKELGRFIDLRYTLHLRQLCIYIKSPAGPV